MRIAVLSDTHGRLPQPFPEAWATADEIWHLGDVGDPSTLFPIEALGVPLRVVRGNTDHHPWPLTLNLTREDLAVHLVHIPPERSPPGIRILLHGHLHQPCDETIDGVRWLSPGAITGPRGGSAASYAWLRLERGAEVGWEIVPLPQRKQ